MTTRTSILSFTALAVGTVLLITLLRSPDDFPPEQSLQEAGRSNVAPESGPRRYRPAPVSPEARQTVDDILSRHQGMLKQQLKESVELNELMNRNVALLNTPDMAAKIEERIAAFPPGNGGGHGTIRMDFDTLDDARARAWLEAAVANDPKRMEDWVLHTLDGAIFEFAFDSEMKRTSNGVSLEPGSTELRDPAGKAGTPR